MKRWLLFGMVACCAAALAQQADPDDDRGVPGGAESAAVQGAARDAGADATTDATTDTAKDAEVDAAETVPGETGSEPDGEFTPSEEISEDYPVPLPSDI